ncbi:MAG TPA: hypothetical protein VK861_00935, partial [Bacteroidales bacterium]|nr:hypothetical protein [Bacteroidales bacterium]
MDRGNGNRKRLMIFFGAIIVLLGIGVTWYANRENNWEKPPAMIVLMNNEVRREALLGTYEWR